MANYATLKADVQDKIKQNGNNEITGNLLQSTLIAMISSLGNGYLYKGIAVPATNPGTPDENVFYIAATAGTYVNFGSIVIDDGEVAILRYSGSWVKELTGAAAASKIYEINQTIWQIQAVVSALNECVSPESVEVDLPYNFEAGYVNANTGAVNTSSTLNTVTGKVPVTPGATIKYIRTKTTDTSGVVTGMAFYKEDGTYVSGIVQGLNAPELGYEEYTTIVPEDAAYARFTIRNEFKSEFYVKQAGVASTISDLEDTVNGKAAATPIHYDRRDAVLGFINTSGVYINNGTNKTIFIPIEAGKTYRVFNNSDYYTRVGVVQDGSYNYNDAVNFADGFTGTAYVAAGSSYTFKAPSNGNYVTLLLVISSGDITPELSEDIVGLVQRIEALEVNAGLRSVNRSEVKSIIEEEDDAADEKK